MKLLLEKVIVIMGVFSGIGEVIVCLFVRKGVKLVIVVC